MEAFRLQGIDNLPTMGHEEICPIIKQYFDFLENALTSHGERVDIDLLQEMLLEISLMLQSGKIQIRKDGYLRLLDRLSTIYAKGLQVENDRAFAGTAPIYANILGSVSQHFHDYDYRESVSLLLHYMDKLFNAREESWLEVYEHLFSMPDSILVMQQLRIEHLNEINCWIEEGVDNLFTLWDEQLELIATQDRTLSDLQLQILSLRSRLQRSAQVAHPHVLDFSLAQQQLKVRKLCDQRDQLLGERRVKLDIADLLESNIREFSDRLATMRRSALLRLVWDNPDPH
jgi:hypothetical protein